MLKGDLIMSFKHMKGHEVYGYEVTSCYSFKLELDFNGNQINLDVNWNFRRIKYI